MESTQAGLLMSTQMFKCCTNC